MDLDTLTLFHMGKKRLDWAAQREQVLATNVANADTPDFRPSDLRPLDFKRLVREQASAALIAQNARAVETHPAHNPGTIPERGPFRADTVRKAYEESPSGNAVVLEDQTPKIAESRGQYELATTLLQKNLRLLRAAIGKNGG